MTDKMIIRLNKVFPHLIVMFPMNVAEDKLQDELDDDEKGGGGGDLEDKLKEEEGPRGTDRLGLVKGWEEERRLSDDGENKQPLMYVWASGGDTQEI